MERATMDEGTMEILLVEVCRPSIMMPMPAIL